MCASVKSESQDSGLEFWPEVVSLTTNNVDLVDPKEANI